VVKEKNIINGMIKSNKKSGGYLSMTERIAIVTGGGDCPGLNTVIRAVVKAAARRGWEVVGFLDGYEGMLEPIQYRQLDYRTVRCGMCHKMCCMKRNAIFKSSIWTPWCALVVMDP
jgi:hypothetical protein